MAQYEITYKCGHAARINLYGKINERLEYLEWAKENKNCPECAAKLEAEKNRQAGLPALEGSEKQVRWAESIRSKFFSAFDEAAETVMGKASANLDLLSDLLTRVKSQYQSMTKASEWIDKRFEMENYNEANLKSDLNETFKNSREK